jgi:hypothetical protein
MSADPDAFDAPFDAQLSDIKDAEVALAVSYAVLFGSQSDPVLALHAERVLADLRDCCFAQRSTQGATASETDMNNGQRNIWLRIQYFLNLPDADVRAMKGVFDYEP